MYLPLNDLSVFKGMSIHYVLVHKHYLFWKWEKFFFIIEDLSVL